MQKDSPEFVIEASSRKLLNWKEIWQYRELFYFFTWRDIKVKYKQTILGFLWAVLQPIFMVLIFTFFFNRALHLPSQGLPYSIFAFSGLIIWTIFSSGISNAGNSMVSNAHIIKKVYFPRLIIPVSAIISASFDFAMGLIVFIILIFCMGVQVSINFLIFWPTAFALVFISSLGAGCLLSALNLKYRDFRYVIPFLLQAVFFLTPIIYPVNMLSHVWIKYILAINPLYAAMTVFRYPLNGLIGDQDLLLISILSGFVLFIMGIIYFKKTESFFADLA